METKVQNIIKVPVTHTDLQKLTNAINNAANPLFTSPMDLLKKFTINMYHILMDFDNGRNIELKQQLEASIENMYNQNDLGEDIMTPGSNTKPKLQNPNNSKNKLSTALPINYNHTESNKTPKTFIEQTKFDRSIRLKLKADVSNRLLELNNYNEETLIDLLSLYIHKCAKHGGTLYAGQPMPKNQFVDNGFFTYLLGFEKSNPIFKNTILSRQDFERFDSFHFYQVHNQTETSNEFTDLTSHYDLSKPISYNIFDLQKNYIDKILKIRENIRNLSPEMLYLNPSHNQPRPNNLTSFDYLNVLFTNIIINGHIETKDAGYHEIIKKYEEPIPVTAFFIQEFNQMKQKHTFGFAQELLFRYGENFNKETQVKLLNHLNDNKVFQFEKTSSFSSYTYEINSLVELSPEKLKDYILETFNLKHVDGFRKFLSNNPQWVK